MTGNSVFLKSTRSPRSKPLRQRSLPFAMLAIGRDHIPIRPQVRSGHLVRLQYRFHNSSSIEINVESVRATRRTERGSVSNCTSSATQ